ncbi:MAG TPA: 3-methyl-2-oxobutanoate hydroxymethyltransferase [Egibacteraceae bacterium]|jgi:3-methyl-2-oxobutanoate hydroxymethyltransferase|nr:3-methyl-2-oxobutanoate hydroxymethyltransferase [Egibacteraceae bacterium]
MSAHLQRPLSIRDVQAYKERGERFAMLTAYDHPTAEILDEAGVPILLVGDSVGDNVLGYDSTVPVTMADMLHHTRAVRRGARRAVVVADLPFMSYQVSVEDGVRNAGRLVKEGGATAVKLEGAARVVDLVARLVAIGIPVMGHLGLTPQSVLQMGHRVQGRDEAGAEAIVAAAAALAAAGAFAIVLEAVPADLARRVTQAVPIPTIGIGAGPGTDAQVMVIHDLLGVSSGRLPRFVKAYADLRSTITDAVKAYQAEVASGDYPAAEHTYT